jgi:hypothetical protein
MGAGASRRAAAGAFRQALAAIALAALGAGCDRPQLLADVPTISLSATELTFTAPEGGGDPEAHVVRVRNAGSGVLAVPIAAVAYAGGSGGWLQVLVDGTAAEYAVTISPIVHGLASGTYAATVTLAAVGAADSPRTVQVTLRVPPPRLALSPTFLRFDAPLDGSDPAGDFVLVANAGAGQLEPPTAAVIYHGADGWLSVDRLVAGPGVFQFGVQPAVAGLAAGVHRASLALDAPGASNAPQVIDVEVHVTPPALSLSTAALDFTGPPEDGPTTEQTIELANLGGLRLPAPSVSFAYPGAAHWLQATVAETAAGPQVAVQALPNGLAPGTYVATMTIDCPGAANSPQTVSVSLHVLPPRLAAATTPLEFGPSAALLEPATVALVNVGGSHLAPPTATVSYAGESDWLDVTVHGNGTWQPYALIVRPTSLSWIPPGDYAAMITVASEGADGSPIAIPVTLHVPPPAMALSDTSISWSYGLLGEETTVPLVISNAGGGTLARPSATVSYGSGSDWLAPPEIVGDGGAYKVKLRTRVSAAGLAPGKYTAVVSFDAPGATNSPQTFAFSVTMTARTPPYLDVGSLATTWLVPEGAMPPARVLPVFASGPIETSVSYSNPSVVGDPPVPPWLTVTTSPGAITLQPNVAGLNRGAHLARLDVSSPGCIFSYQFGLTLRLVKRTWSAAGSMAVARARHTATRLGSDAVLVAGGLTVGGAATATAEIWDPASRAWSPTGVMSVPRSAHVALALPGGKVVVAGGNGADGAPVATAEVYDPETGEWTPAAPMTEPRAWHGAIRMTDGKYLVFGGFGAEGALASAEIFDPATGVWAATRPMRSARARARGVLGRLVDSSPSSAPSQQVVVVVGGTDGPSALATTEIYDPVRSRWLRTGAMSTPRESFALADHRDLIAAGGSDGTAPLASVERYDHLLGAWFPAAPMSTPRASPHGEADLGGNVVVAASGPGAEFYDDFADAWVDAGTFGTPRVDHSVTVLGSGGVLVAGGSSTPDGAPQSSAETSEVMP